MHAPRWGIADAEIKGPIGALGWVARPIFCQGGTHWVGTGTQIGASQWVTCTTQSTTQKVPPNVACHEGWLSPPKMAAIINSPLWLEVYNDEQMFRRFRFRWHGMMISFHTQFFFSLNFVQITPIFTLIRIEQMTKSKLEKVWKFCLWFCSKCFFPLVGDWSFELSPPAHYCARGTAAGAAWSHCWGRMASFPQL